MNKSNLGTNTQPEDKQDQPMEGIVTMIDHVPNERAASAKVAIPELSASMNTNSFTILPDEVPLYDTKSPQNTENETEDKAVKPQTIIDCNTEENLKDDLIGDLTDGGLAQRYANRYRSKVRFCPALGWLVYNGVVWERSKENALQLLDALTREMQGAASAQHTQVHAKLAQVEIDNKKDVIKEQKDKLKQAKEILKYTRMCRSTSRMRSVLHHAECLLVIKREELDKDPYLLNTPSGTFNLKTGGVKSHDPADFCTKVTRIDPDDSSDDEQLMQFLSMILCGDMELLHFVKVALGSALIGKVYEEALLIAYGDGSNGKSTLFNTMATILGSYSGKLPSVALTSKSTGTKHDLAELLGVRFCIAAETEEGMRLSTSMLKQIASIDRISAERKYYDPFDFEPSHLVILFTNHLPKVSSLDSGTWRRIKVIPFDASIKYPDTSFAEKLLKKSGGAFLRWLIEGTQEFISNGQKFPPCETVEQAGKRYKESNDWLQNFLNECVEIGEGEVPAGALYKTYHQWATATKNYPRSQSDFKAAMEAAGFKHRKTNQGARWAGILCILLRIMTSSV